MNEIPAVTFNNVASKTGLMILSAQITISTIAIVWMIGSKKK